MEVKIDLSTEVKIDYEDRGGGDDRKRQEKRESGSTLPRGVRRKRECGSSQQFSEKKKRYPPGE